MTDSLFSHVLLPVASEEDAETTMAAALPYVAAVDGRVTAVNVIEKAGGAPDKAGVEQRETFAAEIFDLVRRRCEAAGVPVETEVVYGTDVVEAIFRAAEDADATAIAFVSRGGSRWVRLITGDVALGLISDNDRPVVSLPDPGESAHLEPEGDGGDEQPGNRPDDESQE